MRNRFSVTSGSFFTLCVPIGFPHAAVFVIALRSVLECVALPVCGGWHALSTCSVIYLDR